MLRTIVCFLLCGVTVLSAQTATQKTYATPDEAREAFLKAIEGGWDAIRSHMGPNSDKITTTGDPVQDKHRLEDFRRRVREKVVFEPDAWDPNRQILLIGKEDWPFAVPLLRKKGRWYFDIEEGKIEIRNRIIGGNELDAMQICRGFVEAQEAYASQDRNGNGLLEYAGRIISRPGQKDGLYWPGDDSPVAEAVAKAIAEGYTDKTKPYHGYYFRVLTGQGPNAEGGAWDYLVRGLMIGGYALVAWPAEYGVSGIKTFLVNQDGVVYEKDLGPKTGALASAMKRFDPDRTWDEAPEVMGEDDSPEK
jgi:hypothetical protein